MVVSVCRTMCAYLQIPIHPCPHQHTLPSCRGDTLGASGAVADVVGEACDCHCVALLVPSVGRINPPATTAVVASVLSVASAKLNRGQIVLAASPHLEAARLAGAMLVGVLTPTIVEVCLVYRWRVRPTVCSSEVRHCVALVSCVVVVCHACIVSSERVIVK